MKNRIKLTESQLRKTIIKIIKEELMNELDDSTMHNALVKTKHDPKRQGQYNRMEKNYSSRIFDKFIGANLLGYYTIDKIELNLDQTNPSKHYEHMGNVNRSFDIYLKGASGEVEILSYMHPKDVLFIGGSDSRTFRIPRKDAILLSKIIMTYYPLTKYKINNINNTFTIEENM